MTSLHRGTQREMEEEREEEAHPLEELKMTSSTGSPESCHRTSQVSNTTDNTNQILPLSMSWSCTSVCLSLSKHILHMFCIPQVLGRKPKLFKGLTYFLAQIRKRH